MDFKAELPSSKSIVNRYLILKEGFPELSLKWKSEALDVVHLKVALEKYKESKELYVGEGGTTLRFLALFLSSQKGEWILKGAVTLFKRPQDELIKALISLGAEARLEGDDSLYIKSEGWQTKEIEVSALKTTQVLTGLILAALSSHSELVIKIKESGENSGYLKLTQDFVGLLGLKVSLSTREIIVGKEQSLKEEMSIRHLESDWSSAAFVYVMASALGKAQVQGLMTDSIQPDSRILDILKESGVAVSKFKVQNKNHGKISYLPININLQDCPDLFPVLSVFACFCRGESVLHGAPQLVFKESNRIELIYRLLYQCGYQVSRIDGGLRVKGAGTRILDHKEFSFDVSSDHRIFMACEILKHFGYKVNMTGTDSIKKSFPEYLSLSFDGEEA